MLTNPITWISIYQFSEFPIGPDLFSLILPNYTSPLYKDFLKRDLDLLFSEMAHTLSTDCVSL